MSLNPARSSVDNSRVEFAATAGANMTAVSRFFASQASLPAMPELAVRLLRSLQRDDLSLSELAGLIGRDPSLSAKVLRLANSARYSPQREIASLRDAASMLGLRSLRDLSLAASLTGMFPQSAGFDRERFWRHSLATAGHARVLAAGCGIDPDVAYLAGLVMRTGRILMLLEDPQAVVRIDALAQSPDSLMQHEMTVLGCTHPQVSAELARRWRLPDLLVLALDSASDPLAAQPYCPLGAVLRAASLLADAGDRGLSELAVLLELQPELVTRLALVPQELGAELLPYEALTIGADQLLD
jgi:HD-like signal output (HDOD) protein